MARSITEISNQIIAEKERRSELNRLSSASAVAVWRLWVYVTAVAIQFHEMVFDLFRKEVEDKIAARQAGTPSWYVARVREFQTGDQLQVVNGVATYPVLDAAKRIVTRSSYKESDTGNGVVLQIKVAKGGVGSEEPLTREEVYQLETYLERIKFAGTKIQVVSLNGDKLRVSAEVFFDGLYDVSVVKKNVADAINNYLVNLDFDGLVYLNRIIDVIQGVPGVIDVSIASAQAILGMETILITRVYETASGYMVEDDTPSYSFNDLITYTPQNV